MDGKFREVPAPKSERIKRILVLPPLPGQSGWTVGGIDDQGRDVYLHPDGKWRETTRNDEGIFSGIYPTEDEARKALAQI